MVGARGDDKPQQGRDHMPGLAPARGRRSKPSRLHDIPARHNAGAPESLRREEEAPVVLAAPRWTVVAHLHRVAHDRSEEHTSELQSRQYLVCRLLLEK